MKIDLAMGNNTPEHAREVPGRIAKMFHPSQGPNPLERLIAKISAQPDDGKKAQEPIMRRTIELPGGLPPVSEESTLGRALKPLLASGGEVKIDDEVSATGMGVDALKDVAEHYRGIFVLNIEKGTVYSPPLVEAQRNRDPQAA